MQRSEIDSKYKWDLSAIYKTDADFDADIKACEALVADFGKNEKTMLGSAEGLLSALKGVAAISAKIEKLWCCR